MKKDIALVCLAIGAALIGTHYLAKFLVYVVIGGM